VSSIEFRNLQKSFGDKQLFSNFNLTIESGRLTVILGPSGCGKSTLLRLIAGLEQPDSGSILIDGQDVTRVEPRRRGVAMVFQNYALYPHLTVRENLGFPLRVAKIPKRIALAKVEEAAELLGLSELLDRYPKTLSGGERQRTAVGRAIVRDPILFLFDEPLSNLDFQLRNRMRGELVALQRTLKKTTVYVTHDQTEGMTMADTLVLMDKGHIVQAGDPGSAYRLPANLFAAGFIGTPPMNIFPGRCERGKLLLGDSQITLSSVEVADGEYKVGIRPNQLRVMTGEDGVALRIDYSEFHGADNYLFGKIGDQTFTALSTDDVRYARGDEVKVIFPASALHFFDIKTGLRLEESGGGTA
jgi:sn-glycerol 3-phosphate transport system ATP-binding protein